MTNGFKITTQSLVYSYTYLPYLLTLFPPVVDVINTEIIVVRILSHIKLYASSVLGTQYISLCGVVDERQPQV